MQVKGFSTIQHSMSRRGMATAPITWAVLKTCIGISCVRTAALKLHLKLEHVTHEDMTDQCRLVQGYQELVRNSINIEVCSRHILE